MSAYLTKEGGGSKNRIKIASAAVAVSGNDRGFLVVIYILVTPNHNREEDK